MRLAHDGVLSASGLWAVLEHDGSFVSRSSAPDVLEIIDFDRGLTSLLLKLIALAELALRASLARRLAEAYGPAVLMQREAFENEGYYVQLRQTVEREVSQARLYKSVSASGESEQQSAPRIWAAVEFTSFGAASKLHQDLSSRDLSVAIAKDFGVKPPLLKNWLRYITQVRNMCAHQNRLYGCRFAFTPRLFREHAGVSKDRLFPIFIVLFHLMDSINPSKATVCRAELDALIRAHSKVDLRTLV